MIILTGNAHLLTDIKNGKVKPKTVMSQIIDRFGQMIEDPDKFLRIVRDRRFQLSLDLELMRSMKEVKPLVKLASANRQKVK